MLAGVKPRQLVCFHKGKTCRRQHLLRSPVLRDHHPPHGHASSAGPEQGLGHSAVAWATPGARAGCQPCLCPLALAGSTQWTCPCGAPFSSFSPSQASLGTLGGIPTILLRPSLQAFCRRDGRHLREAPRKQGGKERGGCMGGPYGLLPPRPLRASCPPTPQGLPPLHPLRDSHRLSSSEPAHHVVPSGPRTTPSPHSLLPPILSWLPATVSPQGLPQPGKPAPQQHSAEGAPEVPAKEAPRSPQQSSQPHTGRKQRVVHGVRD